MKQNRPLANTANNETNDNSATAIEANGVVYDVDEIIGRLKQDRDTQADDLACAGNEFGRAWAAETASFEELSALEALRYEKPSFHDLVKRFESIDVEDVPPEEADALLVSETWARAFGSGFISGALHVWSIVKPKLEAW